MTKIDIFSGFLGAGKTTLIKKLISEAYAGEKVVLIENEFGEIGIDGGFLKDAGVEITEMNSGCICCSLVGDFSKALKKVEKEFAPERIIIEPSGVGKLSDVIVAVERAELTDSVLNSFCTVVDAGKCKMYHKNFGEFFNNQIENASCVVLSHTGKLSSEKIEAALQIIRDLNKTATVVTTDWIELNGKDILKAMQNEDTLKAELMRLAKEQNEKDEEEHEHHHHHHDGEECDDPECECHHHHDDEDEEHGHHHHHHDDEDEEHEHHHHHDDEDEEHEHHHHHHDDEDEEHEHHHHHHHHADDVFTSWGMETARTYTAEEIQTILSSLENAEKFGTILRAKGFVPSENGEWIYFDYVPGEPDVRTGKPLVTGRICVIGCEIKEEAIKDLFRL